MKKVVVVAILLAMVFGLLIGITEMAKTRSDETIERVDALLEGVEE